MRKSKIIKQARLVHTEGREDKAWCLLLKALYCDTDKHSIVIDPATGGSPSQVVREAYNKQRLFAGEFQHVAAIVDGDRPQEEIDEAKALASKYGIELIVVKPCMEAMLLNILEPLKKWYGVKQGHKSYFEEKYIRSNRRTQRIHYEKLFQKTDIEQAISRDATLRRIVEIMGYSD